MFYENLGGFFYYIDLDGLCRLEYVGQNSAGWQEFEVWVWFGDSGIRNESGQQPLEQDGTSSSAERRSMRSSSLPAQGAR